MKSFSALSTQGKQPAHLRIVEGLREQIKSGSYVPGTQLPGTRELAVDWETSVFTVHTALRTLAKEGWVDRRPNSGTYIADPRSRFECAGIYHCADVGSVVMNSFGRYLHFAVLDRLQAIGKTAEIFTDSRPEAEQGHVFSPLAEAIAKKRIQCVIALSLNSRDAAPLARLPLPTAFLTNPYARSTIEPNQEQLFIESARRLAAQGCRTVGLLSNVTEPLQGVGAFSHYYESFRQVVARQGLATRTEWIRHPLAYDADCQRLGYREFKALWSLPERPHGVIVGPDLVAQGAIIAILELGVCVVPPQMKFAFQANAHFPFLCPFPVTWALFDENKQAAGLVRLIEKQFAGEPVEPSFIDFDFSYGASEVGQVIIAPVLESKTSNFIGAQSNITNL